MNKNKLNDGTEHSISTFEAAINNYKLRIGSQLYELVDNLNNPAADMLTSLLSTSSTSSSIHASSFLKNKNIHIFTVNKLLDKCSDAVTHSGINTLTNMKHTALELNFKQNPAVPLTDNNNNPLDENLILQKEMNPANYIVYIYTKFTKMLNISHAGVAIVE